MAVGGDSRQKDTVSSACGGADEVIAVDPSALYEQVANRLKAIGDEVDMEIVSKKYGLPSVQDICQQRGSAVLAVVRNSAGNLVTGKTLIRAALGLAEVLGSLWPEVHKF